MVMILNYLFRIEGVELTKNDAVSGVCPSSIEILPQKGDFYFVSPSTPAPFVCPNFACLHSLSHLTIASCINRLMYMI